MAAISFSAEHIQPIEKDSFSSRVETLLTSRGCSKAWLAEELGVTRQALNHILKHGKKPKFVSEIALVFNVSPKWLETGEGEPRHTQNSLLSSIPLYGLSEISNSGGIKNVSAIEKILLKLDNDHKHFAVLFQKYPSMSARFEENSILIFDAEMEPQNGSYVIANVDKIGIVIRQFFTENKLIILKPSDNAFDIIKCDHCHIIGTLIETRIKF